MAAANVNASGAWVEDKNTYQNVSYFLLPAKIPKGMPFVTLSKN